MIAIIDAGSGNIGSVKRALDHLKIKSKIISHGKDLKSSKYRGIIFPGVGHFGKVMQNLQQRSFNTLLPFLINDGMPYFGICVGLQILFEFTEETLTKKPESRKGWGILKGKVIRFRTGQVRAPTPISSGHRDTHCKKVPQIGWNALENVKAAWLTNNSYVYFVNSFYAVPTDSNITVATSFYAGVSFTSAVETCPTGSFRREGNIKAVQFHPEKSGPVGLEIMRKVLNHR